MNRARKEKLREQIDRLDSHEHAQIFDVIKRYTNSYTKTQSGVLISSDSIPNECIAELEKMVLFYVDQRKRMESDTAQRKSLEKR